MKSKSEIIDRDLQDTLINEKFSVVSVKDSKQLYVSIDSISSIARTSVTTREFSPEEDSVPYSFEVRKDTLFIQNISPGINVAYTLRIGPDIKAFELDNVLNLHFQANINHVLDSLLVKASNSNFSLLGHPVIKYLDFEGNSGSNLKVDNIDKLKINLTQSKGTVNQRVEIISGQLNVNSEIKVPRSSKEINIKKDDTSMVWFLSH